MKGLPFLIPYLIASIMFLGYATEELGLFRVIGWAWLTVALLDLVIRPDTTNPNVESTKNPNISDALSLLAIRLWVPVQSLIILCGLFVTRWKTVTLEDLLLVTTSIGIASGMFCIPVAHELMHKKNKLDKILAEMLMTSVSYTHFCIEHVYGHHRHVGTVLDPATARFSESFYSFYPRTVFGGILNAWDFEAMRLQRSSVNACNPRNRMIRYALCLIATYVSIYFGFGWGGVGFFAAQSIIAFSMLEAINYVEHYGLTRRKTSADSYEPIKPWHSWDSSHRISNWMLFNLGRHSDHHCYPLKNYLYLQYTKESPQLPAGYFGMLFLPLIPFLWKRVMDWRILEWRRNHGA